MYTNVTNYNQDENLIAVTEKVVTRGNADYRTVYIPKGAGNGISIPKRGELKLDYAKVAEAQAQANRIRFDFTGQA